MNEWISWDAQLIIDSYREGVPSQVYELKLQIAARIQRMQNILKVFTFLLGEARRGVYMKES